MKRLIDRRFVVAVLTMACLMTVLLTVAPIRSGSPGAGEYDPWLDWNDDSKIDMKDVSRVARAFGTNGTNVSKASLAYDSGWLDLRNETGEYYTITHNLNDTQLQVDACENSAGWNMTYGGIGEDDAGVLVRTNDGGYALAGRTNSFGNGGYDFWLVKTDAYGTVQWNQTYGGTDDDVAQCAIQTTDGGYVLAGYTTPTYIVNLYIVKTDFAGNEQWNKTFGTTWDEFIYSIVQTNDAGFALAGRKDSFEGTFGYLLKIDSAGNMQWDRMLGSGAVNYVYSMVQTGDGGYALAGGMTVSYPAQYDFYLIKTDSSGNVQWNETYGGAQWEIASSIIRTSDGGYAMAGMTESAYTGRYDFWLVKTDANGNMLWNQTYGGIYNDYALALVQIMDGGYAIAGFTGSFGAGLNDFWLVKTDANGNMLWNKTYGGTNGDRAYGFMQTADGGYALAGPSESFGAGGVDTWFIKTDAFGNIGDAEYGLTWVYSSPNTITLYRGATDTNWNYVRVRLWKPR